MGMKVVYEDQELGFVNIDDTQASGIGTYSSGKIETLLENKQDKLAAIDGTVTNSNPVATKSTVNSALSNYQLKSVSKKHISLFNHYVSGFQGIYKISMPYTELSNTTTQGGIEIIARCANTFRIQFYNFVDTSNPTDMNRIARFIQFEGNAYNDTLLNPILKWDINETSKTIFFYIKKLSSNSRFNFSLLNGFGFDSELSNITIEAVTTIDEYTNARYSTTLQKVAYIN